jgi:lantibiotic modifying enzyme
MNAKKALTGFSHGAGGIAAAPARLHHATQMNRFLTSAKRGLAYERSQFSPARGNWPDFRMTEDATQFSNGWCHGAPGIALSRLCMRSTALWDSTAEQELQIALTTTAQEKAAVDQLCCGEFGKAAILSIAAHCGLGARWAAAAQEIIADRTGNAARHGGDYRLSSLVEGHVFLPGLFTGISGIGLILLSMNDWRVPATCMSCGLLEMRHGVFY